MFATRTRRFFAALIAAMALSGAAYAAAPAADVVEGGATTMGVCPPWC